MPTDRALVPGAVRPGEIRNPTGKNQYTYRTAWNRAMNAALLANANGVKNQTVIDDLVQKLVQQAQDGQPWAFKAILARVWPEVQRHEHSEAPTAPAFNPIDNLDDDDRATMLRLAQKAIQRGSR